jgi:hypothetical protein
MVMSCIFTANLMGKHKISFVMAFFTRIFTVSALAACFGLIAARIPSFGEATPSFSWPGLWVGVGIVVMAFLLSRLFISGAEANFQKGTSLQWFLLRLASICFLAALLLFVAILYTPWSWPRLLLPVVVGGSAISVFMGVVIAALRRGD